MRSWALAFLFCLLSTIANAQVILQKPLTCDSTKSMLEVVQNRYEEKPIWIGTQTQGIILLLANSTTQSWTLLEIHDEVACVLGTGNKYIYYHKNALIL